MEQSKQCRIHRDYYSLQCKDCQHDMEYNYMYNSDCNKCRWQLARQAFTKRNCEVCKKEYEHCNGNTPKICIECIKPYQCRTCWLAMNGASWQNR